jgi:hypothetical protein
MRTQFLGQATPPGKRNSVLERVSAFLRRVRGGLKRLSGLAVLVAVLLMLSCHEHGRAIADEGFRGMVGGAIGGLVFGLLIAIFKSRG